MWTLFSFCPLLYKGGMFGIFTALISCLIIMVNLTTWLNLISETRCDCPSKHHDAFKTPHSTYMQKLISIPSQLFTVCVSVFVFRLSLILSLSVSASFFVLQFPKCAAISYIKTLNLSSWTCVFALNSFTVFLIFIQCTMRILSLEYLSKPETFFFFSVLLQTIDYLGYQ